MSTLDLNTNQEITKTEIHTIEACQHCGGKVEETEECVIKDELDYELVVIKKRHHFPVCKCMDCGRKSRQAVPMKLKEEPLRHACQLF